MHFGSHFITVAVVFIKVRSDKHFFPASIFANADLFCILLPFFEDMFFHLS